MDKAIWILIFAIFFLPYFAAHFGTPMPYRYRPCMGFKWKKTFPEHSNDSIRLFLSCLTYAMAFPESDRLNFEPNDCALEIYRSIYGGVTPFSDSMECEEFVDQLSESFNKPVSVIIEQWKTDTRLSELYRCVAT